MLTNNNNDATNNILYLEGSISEGRVPERVLAYKR